MLRVDPTAFAREREARIERAAELRAARNRNTEEEQQEEQQQQQPRRRRRHREIAPGWTQHTCKKTGKFYYHHASSGKTTWIRPPEAEPLCEASNFFSEAEFEEWISLLKSKTLTGSQTRRLATLLQGSEGDLSSLKTSMKKNSELRSQSASASSSAAASASTQPVQRQIATRPEWNNDFSTKEEEEEEVLPSGWTKHKDRKSGRFFYRNQERKESTWRKPQVEEEEQGSSYRQLWRPEDRHGEDQETMTRRRRTSEFESEFASKNPQEEEEEDVEKESCALCGRVMTKHALEKMEKVHGLRCCPKCAPTKKRKQFNAAARRAQGIAENPEDRMLVKQGIATVKRDLKENSSSTTPSSNSKWKAQSDQLRRAMRSMRSSNNQTPLKEKRSPLTASSSSQPDPTLVPCPHCGRRFNQQAADRHIPKCQDIKAKPKMLKRGAGTPGPVRHTTSAAVSETSRNNNNNKQLSSSRYYYH